MLKSPIDNHAFLKKGYAKSAIPDLLADRLVRAFSKIEFAPLPSDHGTTKERYVGNIEENQGVYRLLEDFWRKLSAEDLGPLSELYRGSNDRFVITLLRLGDGYHLDWHNHLSAGPTASVLLYLFSGEDVGEGGDLVLGELGPDLKSVNETVRFKIDHGDVIMIGDASHPLLQHKAETWQGRGYRYLLSFGFNADEW